MIKNTRKIHCYTLRIERLFTTSEFILFDSDEEVIVNDDYIEESGI